MIDFLIKSMDELFQFLKNRTSDGYHKKSMKLVYIFYQMQKQQYLGLPKDAVYTKLCEVLSRGETSFCQGQDSKARNWEEDSFFKKDLIYSLFTLTFSQFLDEKCERYQLYILVS